MIRTHLELILHQTILPKEMVETEIDVFDRGHTIAEVDLEAEVEVVNRLEIKVLVNKIIVINNSW